MYRLKSFSAAEFFTRFSLGACLLWLTLGALVTQAQTKPTLLVLNKADGSLTLIDPLTMNVSGNIPVGDNPHEVVVSTDGKLAFVANYGAQTPGNSLSVINLAAQKELRRVDLSPLLRPHGLQFLGGKLYFTAEINRLIARYDPATNKLDWLMGTGQNTTHMIVGTTDQKRFYTTNIASDNVTAFEFQTAPPAASKVTHIPVGKQPEAIDLSPDGKEVWVGLNAEGAVEVIDTAANKVVARIKLGERPYRVKFTPDGKFAVMTMPNTKELIVIEAATRTEVKRIKLESTPLGIVFAKDGKTAFVTAVQNDFALKIDMDKGAVVAQVATGKAPDGIALAGM